MEKSILARNILIHGQFGEIAKKLSEENLPVILLKGIALIEAMPEYMNGRVMQDIDLMFRPQDMGKARGILSGLGYKPAPDDPWSFIREGGQAYVDIIDGLWYLDRDENAELWKASADYALSGNVFHLPPDEFYIHVLTHAAAHHGQKEDKWLTDLELIGKKWKLRETEIFEGKLKEYGLEKICRTYLKGGKGFYSGIINSSLPLKGHVLRFLSLRPGMKIGYLFSSLFPPREFLASRYRAKSGPAVLFFRFLRPFLLAGKLFCFARRSIFRALTFNN
ncbi:MAG: nucleotidyltransferase family protein [Elusimicrobiota bacterium]